MLSRVCTLSLFRLSDRWRNLLRSTRCSSTTTWTPLKVVTEVPLTGWAPPHIHMGRNPIPPDTGRLWVRQYSWSLQPRSWRYPQTWGRPFWGLGRRGCAWLLDRCPNGWPGRESEYLSARSDRIYQSWHQRPPVRWCSGTTLSGTVWFFSVDASEIGQEKLVKTTAVDVVLPTQARLLVKWKILFLYVLIDKGSIFFCLFKAHSW